MPKFFNNELLNLRYTNIKLKIFLLRISFLLTDDTERNHVTSLELCVNAKYAECLI